MKEGEEEEENRVREREEWREEKGRSNQMAHETHIIIMMKHGQREEEERKYRETKSNRQFNRQLSQQSY